MRERLKWGVTIATKMDTVSIIWIPYLIQTFSIICILYLIQIETIFKRLKQFLEKLDTVFKRWKHLETFHEKEGLFKID